MIEHGTRYVTGWQLSHYPGAGPDDGMAVTVVSAGPPTPEEERVALGAAGDAIRESFRERGIPAPPGGWQLALLHPDEDWRQWVSPNVAADAEAKLAAAVPGSVVTVVYAFRFHSW